MRKFTNATMTGLVHLAMLLALIPLVWLLFELFRRGFHTITKADWWLSSQLGVMYSQPGGGALHAIVGTLVQVGIAALISIPLGIAVAIYLVEYQGRNRLVTFMVDVLTGVPSIVAALFVYSLWIVLLGFDRSGAAVSLALVLLMIPVVVRNTEEILKTVPSELREAAWALGIPRWRTIISVVLPTAASGIITGIMLALARVMGESAPVLILVGSTQLINWDAFAGPQSSLPLMMVDMYKAGAIDPVLDKLWGAALTLVLLITAFNILARIIGRKHVYA